MSGTGIRSNGCRLNGVQTSASRTWDGGLKGSRPLIWRPAYSAKFYSAKSILSRSGAMTLRSISAAVSAGILDSMRWMSQLQPPYRSFSFRTLTRPIGPGTTVRSFMWIYRSSGSRYITALVMTYLAGHPGSLAVMFLLARWGVKQDPDKSFLTGGIAASTKSQQLRIFGWLGRNAMVATA